MSPISFKKIAIFAVAAMALAVVVSGCGSSNGGSSATGPKVALLLPESKTARYETQDRPLFTKKVKALCANCDVLYSNADQDASKQQQQAEAALTQGAKVLVLDPVDAASAATIVKEAKAQKVPVVSYDRLVSNAGVDYYISYDNEKVGKLQATSLLDKMKADGNGTGTIFMVNGAPTDNNAKLFKAGAHSVFDKSGLKIGKEYDTPDWSPDKAQDEAQQAITALGKNGFQGVYAANDGNAGGVIAAEKSAGVDPTKIPLTGQDAEVAGVQSILNGDQYMTVYKAIKPEAADAAIIAVALAQGKTPDQSLITGKVSDGTNMIPSVIFNPVAVTKANVKSTIIKDGFWTAAQICTSAYKAACTAAGIN